MGSARPGVIGGADRCYGNDLEHRFGVAAVVACSVTLIVTGAPLAAGLKAGRG